ARRGEPVDRVAPLAREHLRRRRWAQLAHVAVFVAVRAVRKSQPLEARRLAGERTVAVLAGDADVPAAQRKLGVVVEGGVLVVLDELPPRLGVAGGAGGAARTLVRSVVAGVAARSA